MGKREEAEMWRQITRQRMYQTRILLDLELERERTMIRRRRADLILKCALAVPVLLVLCGLVIWLGH